MCATMRNTLLLLFSLLVVGCANVERSAHHPVADKNPPVFSTLEERKEGQRQVRVNDVQTPETTKSFPPKQQDRGAAAKKASKKTTTPPPATPVQPQKTEKDNSGG
jgi:hypothetical protein